MKTKGAICVETPTARISVRTDVSAAAEFATYVRDLSAPTAAVSAWAATAYPAAKKSERKVFRLEKSQL